jgi:hypothetical protein
VPLVPLFQLGGSGGGQDGNAFSTLLSLMASLKAQELASGQGAKALPKA